MTEHEKLSIVPLGGRPDEKLAFRIELWDEATGETVERVLARAHNAPLARAIFKAVLVEHPDRRITLRSGARVLEDSRRNCEPPDRAP